MDNLKLPAYPAHILLDDKQNTYISSLDLAGNIGGFTKLELASLMIAAGYASQEFQNDKQDKDLAQWAVSLAQAVLEEANK